MKIKKLLSILMCAVLTLALLPTTVRAAGSVLGVTHTTAGNLTAEITAELGSTAAEDYTAIKINISAVDLSGDYVSGDWTTLCNLSDTLPNVNALELVYKSGDHTIPAAAVLTGAEWLKTLTFTNDGGSLVGIGPEAFSNSKLTGTLTIPSTVTSIGDSAFTATDITSLILPETGSLSIGDAAFNCAKLTGTLTIPSSVTSIGIAAFNCCSGLTNVTILDGVTSIGEGAFNGCISLVSFNVGESNANYAAVNGVLFNKDKTVLIRFPASNPATSYDIPNSVTSIDSFAFENCTGLKSVTIPDSVTSIGNYNTFMNCTGLTSITLPDGIASIGNHTFENCTSLTSVTIPDSVTDIGGLAFYECTNLDAIVFQNTTSAPTLGNPITDQPLTVYYPAAAESSYTAQSGLPPKRVSYDDSTALFTHFYLGDVRGVIDETAKTITVDLGTGTTLTGLTADVGYIGSSMTPTGAQDFSSRSRVYTVTPTSGSPVTYTVNIYSHPSVSGSNNLAGSLGNVGDKTVSATISGSFPKEIVLTASVGGKTATATRTGNGSVTFTFPAADLNTLSAGSYTITVTAAATANNQAVASTNVGTLMVYSAPTSGGYSTPSGGYSPTNYTITASAGTGGSISPSGSSSIEHGYDFTYAITADMGFKIEDVLVDGDSVGAVSAYTFKDVSRAHTISAVFKSTENPFKDINNDNWFFESVMYVYENGLMTGTSSDGFSPNGTTTRAMFATVLYRLSGDTGSYTNAFSDIPSGEWYENSAAWAAANGIAGGVGGNQFSPKSSLTREQLAVMLFNYAKYKGLNMTAGESTNILSYNDATSISEYAYSALQWACGSGIIKGNDSGNLNLQSPASRAEVAAILERFIKNSYRTEQKRS